MALRPRTHGSSDAVGDFVKPVNVKSGIIYFILLTFRLPFPSPRSENSCEACTCTSREELFGLILIRIEDLSAFGMNVQRLLVRRALVQTKRYVLGTHWTIRPHFVAW